MGRIRPGARHGSLDDRFQLAHVARPQRGCRDRELQRAHWRPRARRELRGVHGFLGTPVTTITTMLVMRAVPKNPRVKRATGVAPVRRRSENDEACTADVPSIRPVLIA